MLDEVEKRPRDIIARELGEAEPGRGAGLTHSGGIDRDAGAPARSALHDDLILVLSGRKVMARKRRPRTGASTVGPEANPGRSLTNGR